ncbi:alpha/beta hydrolase family esterase [Fibrobacterota bacterium]
MRNVVYTIISIFLFTSAQAQESRTITVDDTVRTYLLDIPGNYDGTEPFGLVLAFHGLGGSAEGTRTYMRFHEFGEQDRYITVWPQGLDIPSLLTPGTFEPGWYLTIDNNRDVMFVELLLDSLERDLNIDPGKIFVTGISNGGFFSDILGCQLGDRLAAIAPVIGGASRLQQCSSNPLPMFRLGTVEDEVVDIEYLRDATAFWVGHNNCNLPPVQDGMCDVYSGCAEGAEVRHCEYECQRSGLQQQCHTWPMGPAYDFETTELVLDFFRRHGLSAGASIEKKQAPFSGEVQFRYMDQGPSQKHIYISYGLRGSGNGQVVKVKLSVYSLSGEPIEVLVDKSQTPGSYHARWEAGNISSGIYILRLEAGASDLVNQVLLIY